MITSDELKHIQNDYKFEIETHSKGYSIRSWKNGCAIRLHQEEFERFGINVESFEKEILEKQIDFSTTPGNPNHYYEFFTESSANTALDIFILFIARAQEEVRQALKEKKSHMMYRCPFCNEELPSQAIKHRLKNDKEFTHCPECGEKIIL